MCLTEALILQLFPNYAPLNAPTPHTHNRLSCPVLLYSTMYLPNFLPHHQTVYLQMSSPLWAPSPLNVLPHFWLYTSNYPHLLNYTMAHKPPNNSILYPTMGPYTFIRPLYYFTMDLCTSKCPPSLRAQKNTLLCILPNVPSPLWTSKCPLLLYPTMGLYTSKCPLPAYPSMGLCSPMGPYSSRCRPAIPH